MLSKEENLKKNKASVMDKHWLNAKNTLKEKKRKRVL